MQQEQYIHIDKYGHKRYSKVRVLIIAHRLDGPAIEYANGSKAWYVDGQLHRLDGPAYESTNGYKAWYVDGKHLSEEQFNALTAPAFELTLEEIAAKFGVDVSKIKIKK
jgi:hypothetical protein